MKQLAELLADLPVFVRVAEAQSFSHAARRLGLSASAASKAVSRLERRVGVMLLHRTTRRVSLTEDGAAFFERCRRLLAEVEEASRVLRDARARPSGSLRVALPSALGRLLVPALPTLLRSHRGLILHVDLSDRVVDVLDEGFDAAVRVGGIGDDRLIARPIAETRFVVCASAAYLRRHGEPRTPDALAAHNVYRFALVPGERPSRWTFERDERRVSVDVSGNLALSSGDALMDAALAGDGIIGTFDFMAARAIDDGRLVPLLTDWRTPPGPAISIVYPQHRHLSAKVRVFVDFAASAIAAATAPRPAASQRTSRR